jgi:hypothetical protein
MPIAFFRATGIAILTLLPSAALAEPKPCTCQNLESLQQEYTNARYLEGYMQKLAQHLRGVEEKQRQLNTTSNSDPDQGGSIFAVAAAARDSYGQKNLRLPFPTVKDYTGPRDVSLAPGQCRQSPGALQALEEGSPCEAIADAALAHEQAHTDICLAMGSDAYWTRLPSEIAEEEARQYKAQALNLKAELRRVMDVSDLRLVGKFRQHLVGEQGETSDQITYDSGDLSLASQGGDRWTMSGDGDTVTQLDMVSYDEPATCTTGPVRRKFSVSLTTDGLTADVDLTGHSAIDAQMTCTNGTSMPMYGGEFGSQQTKRLKVQTGDTPWPTENDWLLSGIMGAATAGGGSMMIDQETILQLTCEGQ